MEVNPSALAPMKGPMASLPKLRRKPEVGTVECVRGSVSPLSDGPYVKAWAGEPVGSEPLRRHDQRSEPKKIAATEAMRRGSTNNVPPRR
jgi:hypothetical protein